MTTIYLIRHAQAEGNLYRRCHGWYDSMLTALGRRQVQALAARFEGVHIDAAYSSDLTRTMETAKSVCLSRGLSLCLDPDLREIGAGCWEDRSWGDLLHADLDNLRKFFLCDPQWHVDGSETFPGVRERMMCAITSIAASHPDQTVAIFSHGSAIRAALSGWLGVPLEEIGNMALGDNTCVAKLEVQGDQVLVDYYNDNSHLGDLANRIHPKDNSGGDMLENLKHTSLRFRPLRLPQEIEFYQQARQEAWLTSHGTMDCFTPDSFLAVMLRNSDYAPESVLVALLEDRPAGILQMDWQQQADEGVGRIPFFCVLPPYRSHGLGIQMLGQAISSYRKLGRKRLLLRCAPENERAKNFYLRHEFHKIGEEPGGTGVLDTMEKYI